jgi:glycine/D-amino acid oxidase-like deaminating enzyme
MLKIVESTIGKMALRIDELSYWERISYFEGIDFLIIGAGIVGLSAALELRGKYPKSKILIIERGYLPSGASTKNAGFACFGSPTEILEDLSRQSGSVVWDTVAQRWEGLQRLIKMTGEKAIDFEMNGSWDLILESQSANVNEISEALPNLNQELKHITKQDQVFIQDDSSIRKFGFTETKTSFYNRLEGQLNTGKLIQKLYQLAIDKAILCLFGIEIQALQSNLYNVGIQSNIGYFKAANVLVCTNGFAKQFLPSMDIQPARAQVIVTTPIENLKIKGTFHIDRGYFYFRNVEDRLLIGGGRNLDFDGETTTQFGNTTLIVGSIEELLHRVILPNQEFSIAYQWSGIMGVGDSKAPIVTKIDDKIGVGVRLGGMGVAIGSLVGKDVANLF